MNKEEDLKKYLQHNADLIRNCRQKIDWKYNSYEELILNCGFPMQGKSLPKNVKRSQPKTCYYNCQTLAFKHQELIYVEGYAIAHDINLPLAHAWLMTKEGVAVDPTWETPGSAYFGVPLFTDWVKSFLQLRGRRDDLSIFDGNYIEKYSLLKQGLPIEATVTSNSFHQTGANIL